jgi:hypothetical protein
MRNARVASSTAGWAEGDEKQSNSGIEQALARLSEVKQEIDAIVKKGARTRGPKSGGDLIFETIELDTESFADKSASDRRPFANRSKP